MSVISGCLLSSVFCLDLLFGGGGAYGGGDRSLSSIVFVVNLMSCAES